MILVLTSLEATAALARAFAECIADSPALPPVLLRGQLGAGKTTFIRELVQALPGSENAEVSSPSFNILNLYPTTPPVGHFDLYRTEGRDFDPDLEETLFAPDHFCLLEWAEYLPADCMPDSHIDMSWTAEGETRTVEITAHGPEALALLGCLEQATSI
ncbi:tRNA threonylcarbamoyladenosine biosynthesis protein TsaE [Desulfomicrobium macestii]|uniref:tRNA threonylcarbamoyladenosine biosynthesis protein TsaE n=2 Tax=Desulfomicrobium TaxID=898 RepID=A0A8G2C2P9_DESNO|nr:MULTISPECIES: tRNA (adenosine(37)-N6)-threonylcarbamoyltransferase complex ATPase subunit type 1 TsaE [Desulfomicrobium]MBE1425805.1 tRNA threonylcarbamoyladenosine biosynthesis protein TsaE [Desulfomicrobium macestii]SFL61229.1 tRNA threonylcarbamoyladenosine biosynthesis protein TsaE [Desulfomicrobium norvegicum]